MEVLEVGQVTPIQEILGLEIHHLPLQVRAITAEQGFRVETEEAVEVLAV